MSLINQMLKDLEQRHSWGKRPANNTSLSGAALANQQLVSSHRWRIALLVIVLFSAVILMFAFVGRAKMVTMAMNLMPHSATAPKLHSVATPIHLKPRKQLILTNTVPPKKRVVKNTPPLADKTNSVLPVKVLQPLTAQQQAEQDYRNAMKFVALGNYRQAMLRLKKIIVKQPRYNAAKESLAVLLLRQGSVNQAERILQAARAQSPHYLPFIRLLARVYIKRGKTLKALQILLPNAPSMQQEPEYYAFIAGLYEQSSQPKLAAKLYAQLLQIEPNNGIWWMGFAVSLEQTRQYNRAIIAYQRARNSGMLNPALQVYVDERIATLQG